MSAGTFVKQVTALALWMSLFITMGCAAAPPANAPGTAPALPDPNLWTRRNLELLKQAQELEKPNGEGQLGSLLEFSLVANPMLVTDEYAPKVLAISEAAIAKQPDPEKRASIEKEVAFLRRPFSERQVRQLMQKTDLDEPVIYAGNESNFTSTLTSLPNGPLYEELLPNLLEQQDKVSRDAGKWQGLALAYYSLAADAQSRHREDRTKLYTDRMLEILREHMLFQDPRRGNSDGVMPENLATMLLSLDRRKDLDDLIDRASGDAKIQLVAGTVDALIRAERIDDARATIESKLKPISPDGAARITAALDGKDAPASTSAPAARIQPSRLGRLGQKLEPPEAAIAGAASTAAQYHFQQAKPAPASQPDKNAAQDLKSFEWARLGLEAHEKGNDAGARDAFEKALNLLAKDPAEGPESGEKVKFVREAISLGDYDLANELLNTSSAAGAWGRYELSTDYRKRGDVGRARALQDEALEIAKQEQGGSTMAEIAVDLYRAGEHKRAEKIFLDAMNHIHGEDFGFGGTSDVVHAAMKMNRLDLLDRLYEQSEPGGKLLLSIVAARVGAYGDVSDEH